MAVRFALSPIGFESWSCSTDVTVPVAPDNAPVTIALFAKPTENDNR